MNLSKRQALTKKIALLKQERDEIGIKIQQLEFRLMDKCTHPFDAIREGRYIPAGNWGSATPDMRVCTDCGYAEEGWGCGYWKLNVDYTLRDSIPQISRDEAFKHVRKFWTQEAMSQHRFPSKE